MSKTFFPLVSILVEADTNYTTAGTDYHPENTQYKVSIGYEIENGNSDNLVKKIQICYNGKISGRRSPSFPFLSKDWNHIGEAMKKVETYYNKHKDENLKDVIL